MIVEKNKAKKSLQIFCDWDSSLLFQASRPIFSCACLYANVFCVCVLPFYDVFFSFRLAFVYVFIGLKKIDYYLWSCKITNKIL